MSGVSGSIIKVVEAVERRLERATLLEMAAPEFFKAIRAAEIDSRPLADLERVAAEPAQLSFDIFLEDAHRGHHDDDREHSHQDTQQGERRTQLMRGNRVYGHEKALLHFSAQYAAEGGARGMRWRVHP
jgi:hypothetical protein